VGDVGTDDDEKVSTPVGDEPRWDGAGDRDVSGRTRRGRGERAVADPVTVEQLLARQGSTTGRRRAARRDVEQPVPRYERPRYESSRHESSRHESSHAARRDPSPAVRTGMPPVPGAEPHVSPRAGLPPVPATSRSRPLPEVAPLRRRDSVPVSAPASWVPESRPSRRSGPIPPLPGRRPASGATAAVPPKGRRPKPDRPPVSRSRRRLGRVVMAVVALFGVVVLYHLGLYFYVDQKIDRVSALATDGPEVLAPQLQAGNETYLVVGTGVPGQQGPDSVATLLASVSPKGDRAVLVSVPPTALIDTPMCRTADGSLRDPTTEAFAAALLDGGPSCLVRAVQQLSGLRVDHYLGVDLARLPGMVDALGGVPFCVVPSEAVSAAAMPPPPGPSDLTGDAAAGFLQPKDPAVDVSGAAVAERAQRLLISTMRAALTVRTLVDTPTLTRFLSRAADALTVDEQTTLGDLRSLAGSLGNLTGDAVQRTGLPIANTAYVPPGAEESYVLLDGGATRTLFDSVIRATRLPDEVLADGEAAPADAEAQGQAEAKGQADIPAAPAPPVEQAGPAAGGNPLTVPPAGVTVDVLNATGTRGLAATAADALAAEGFTVGEVGNEPGQVESSVVRHGPDALEQARTVAAAVPGAVLQASDALAGKVQLVLGPGYETVIPVTMPTAPAPQAPASDTAPRAATIAAPVSCG
jgi:LCP family protein required for cell wall assembly